MFFNPFIYILYFVLFFGKQTLSGDTTDPISIFGAVFDEAPTPGRSSEQPPMKISTGRMKAISHAGSPRMTVATAEMNQQGYNRVKGISHTAVMANPTSSYTYPKITVRPGKKDVSVMSVFHHPARLTPNSKPYEYMQDKKSDSLEDISRPAQRYKIGLRKIHGKSPELEQAREESLRSSRSHYHPKAALIQTLKGDSRAKRKRPTIDVEQGKLHGNLAITTYGPESPPKNNNQGHQHQEQPHPHTSTTDHTRQ